MNDAMSGRALNDRANDYDVHDRMNGSNEASAVDGFDGVAVLDVCTCRIRSDFRRPDAIYTARCTTTAWWRSFVVGLIVDSNCSRKIHKKGYKMVTGLSEQMF